MAAKIVTTTFRRISDLGDVRLYLHDESFLEVLLVKKEEEENGVRRLFTFKHRAGGVQSDDDDMLGSWDVYSFSSKLEDGKETIGLWHVLEEGKEAKTIRNVKEYAGYLWCTLYWYFHLPVKSFPENAKPGAPRREEEVWVEGYSTILGVGEKKKKKEEEEEEDLERYKGYIEELEQAGLLSCTNTTAARYPEGGEGAAATVGGTSSTKKEDEFFITRRTFWQIPFHIFYHHHHRTNQPQTQTLPTAPKPLDLLHSALGTRHPYRTRPPAPGTTFYKRYIPSLNSYLSFRTADLSTDVHLLHKWMNNKRVDHFWGEAGPISHQQTFLENALNSRHCFPVIASWKSAAKEYVNTVKEEKEEEPFGYFEIYWVREDRLAAYTATGLFDRGVHVLVGEEKYRGPLRIKAWLGSLVHYMFLDDPRTQTVMLEPRIDNEKFINYLVKAGFYKEKEFAFPHKQAAVMKLEREAWSGLGV